MRCCVVSALLAHGADVRAGERCRDQGADDVATDLVPGSAALVALFVSPGAVVNAAAFSSPETVATEVYLALGPHDNDKQGA